MRTSIANDREIFEHFTRHENLRQFRVNFWNENITEFSKKVNQSKPAGPSPVITVFPVSHSEPDVLLVGIDKGLQRVINKRKSSILFVSMLLCNKIEMNVVHLHRTFFSKEKCYARRRKNYG